MTIFSISTRFIFLFYSLDYIVGVTLFAISNTSETTESVRLIKLNIKQMSRMADFYLLLLYYHEPVTHSLIYLPTERR